MRRRVPNGAGVSSKDNSGNGYVPSPHCLRHVPRPSYSSISTESPVSAQDDTSSAKAEDTSSCDQSPSTTLDLRGQLLCTVEASVVVLETGATAAPARFRRLGNRNLPSRAMGFPGYRPIRPAHALNLVMVALARYDLRLPSLLVLRGTQERLRPLRWKWKFRRSSVRGGIGGPW